MKFKMKLARKHPHNAMNFGDHVVTNVEQIFELSKTEIEMLKMSEPKHWFIVEKVEAKKGRKPQGEKEVK